MLLVAKARLFFSDLLEQSQRHCLKRQQKWKLEHWKLVVWNLPTKLEPVPEPSKRYQIHIIWYFSACFYPPRRGQQSGQYKTYLVHSDLHFSGCFILFLSLRDKVLKSLAKRGGLSLGQTSGIRAREKDGGGRGVGVSGDRVSAVRERRRLVVATEDKRSVGSMTMCSTHKLYIT